MRKLVASVMSLIMLTGCAVRDPKIDLSQVNRSQYDADLEECREQSDVLFTDAWQVSALGAIIGASLVMVGLRPESLLGLSRKEPLTSGQWLALAGGLTVGAVIGLVIGTTVRPESNRVFKACLRLRGYQVSEMPWLLPEPEPAGLGI